MGVFVLLFKPGCLNVCIIGPSYLFAQDKYVVFSKLELRGRSSLLSMVSMVVIPELNPSPDLLVRLDNFPH